MTREDTDTSGDEVLDPCRLHCALPQWSQLVFNLHAQKQCEPPTPPPAWAAVCSTYAKISHPSSTLSESSKEDENRN